MNPLIKLLKQKSIFAVIAFILLICLVLLGGSRYRLPLNSRLLIVLILIFMGTFFLLLKQLKANRGAAQLEQSIKSQADDQKMSLRPEKRAEIEELKHELLAAIASLKSTKLGKGRSGRAALYALPWYMFIGPPAAGKTTAIINSGLEFPYGTDIKGIGGTRNCDWFFSNSAIILDTAGRYVAEDEDREEWQAFLGVLKKHRPKRPINGVVVGMSLTDILDGNKENLEWHAKNIRRRIDELIQRLGIRFPVYLVFTKCDLLQGFVELFESYNRKEREQIWGCTFARGQQPGLDPRDVFDQEFNLLVQSLNDVRLRQLSGAPKPENRANIYAFPLQFASIKESTGEFIHELFRPNPYQESPHFRGFYFTSGTQEGIPIDRVIQAIARQFDLPSELVSQPEIQKKSYFIKDLFSEIIIPDQNSVFHTSKVTSQKSRARIVTIVASAVLLGIFIFGVTQAFIGSRMSLNSLYDASKQLRDVSWNTPEAVTSSLKFLDRYREALESLEQRSEHPPLIRSGMDRGDTVLGPARQLYLKTLGPFIKDYGYQELTERLRASRQGTPYSQAQIKSYLQGYLLMGSQVDKLNSSNITFLQQQLFGLLNEQYSRLFPQDKTEEFRPLLKRQIDYFVHGLSLEKTPTFDNDPTLIAEVRSAIFQKPSPRAVYDSMKDAAAIQLAQPQTLSQILLDPQDKEWISSDQKIPEFFTKDGWQNKVQELIQKEVENPEKGDWVLGHTPKQLGDELQDPKKLAGELRRFYFQEYAETWWQFLRSIHYKPFDNLDTAARLLKRMASPDDSPLNLILKRVAEQTDFPGESAGGVFDKLKDAVSGTGQKQEDTPPQLLVDQHQSFAKLRSLIPPAGKDENKGGELSGLLTQFSGLGEILGSMLGDPGSKAKEYAAKVLQQGTGELPEALKTVRRMLNEEDFDAEARRALFEQPLKNVWSVLLSETQGQLNTLWKTRVYGVFQNTLARYYPFERKAAEDASLLEMKRFFGPQEGTLWKYVEEELKGFVKMDSWAPLTWEDKGILLSQETAEALTRATTIKQDLLSENEFRIRFKMIPDDPPYRELSETKLFIDQIDISIDGNTYSYRMGFPAWTDFSWPGQQGLPGGASLMAYPRKASPIPMRIDGEWGWLKLLEAARIEEINSRVYRLTWTIGEKELNPVEIRYKLQVMTPLSLFKEPKSYFNLRFAEKLD
jgi:type VI secretion system protein ImpL